MQNDENNDDVFVPPAPDGLRRFWGRRVLSALPILLIALVGLSAAGVSTWRRVRPPVAQVRLTAGDALGRRHQIALLLASEARPRGVAITVTPTTGSTDALRKVASGELDAALVQGGVGDKGGVSVQDGGNELTQIAALVTEPMHLLVKSEFAPAAARSLSALRGRRINLSTPGSGTRRLATTVLGFAGLTPGVDFEDIALPYDALDRTPYTRLPDAVFVVSLMPSQVVEDLTRRNGYRLIALPYAPALALRDPAVREAVIPACAYGASPPVPERDVRTVGARLLLVTRRGTPPATVAALLAALYSNGQFARQAVLPDMDEATLAQAPELPLHAGTVAYLRRNEPVITNDKIEGLENARSLLVSIAVAGFFAWRWLRSRRFLGFESYLSEITRIEQEILTREREDNWQAGDLPELRNRLSKIKTDALLRFARGELRGEELMSAFLTHAADVRAHLNSLILSERDRKVASAPRATDPDRPRVPERNKAALRPEE